MYRVAGYPLDGLSVKRMNSEPGHVSEGSPSSQNAPPQPRAGFGPQHPPGAAVSPNSRTFLNYPVSWWEAGWFKEWERAARQTSS